MYTSFTKVSYVIIMKRIAPPKNSLNSPISVGQSTVGKERTIGIQACFDRCKDDLG